MSPTRVSSCTPLHDSSLLPLHKGDSIAVSATSWMIILGGKMKRQIRHRASLVAVLSLAILSTYIFFHHPTLVSSLVTGHRDSRTSNQISLALENMTNSRLAAEATERYRNAAAFHLNSEQELAAVTGFLTSLPRNIIPSSVDPLLSIDPQLVLDFDTRTTRVTEAVEEMVHDVWSNNPVMFYSKYHSAGCREIKRRLASFHLQPPPTIIDVDIRDDSEVLAPILFRLTSSTQLPILLVGGEPMGTLEEIREKALSGELQHRIRESGAVIDGAKRREGRK